MKQNAAQRLLNFSEQGKQLMAHTAAVNGNEERIGRPGDPCVMVIFGASGDLTRRKLIPALYNLGKHHLLSREFAVVGVARDAMTTDEFRDQRTFLQLRDLLQKLDVAHATHGNYFYYLAIAPDFFGSVVEQLHAVGLMTEENHHWRRVIVEKPFGR